MSHDVLLDSESAPKEVRLQVEALRSKLLDLSMRNRMLNYKPSKRLGVTVLGESSYYLHKMLVEESKKFSFVGRPDPPKKGTKQAEFWEQEDEVALAEFRQAAEEELDAFLENPVMPVDQLDTKLNTDEFESILQAKLRVIAREAKTANEELGINTLFLTLGALEWREIDERSYRAPLIFVPVQLELQANGAIRLTHDGSDPGTNLPLRAKLTEFGIALPDLGEDKSLTDYFSEVASTIRKRNNWEVHPDEVCLGFFNYEKYAMYVDLGGEAWPEGRKPWQHGDLTSMLGGGYSSPDSPVGDGTFLDPFRPVATTREVFDADSSQTIAMIRAAAGLSIVVEGPPGTGKSQTITNIIAEAIAAGKTVLFVSAKRAALDVVKRNLERADLGPVCLDLHDKMTNRREFYAEIKRTAGRALTLRAEEAKVARLSELRDKLNAHSQAVNESVDPYGVSPSDAMCALAVLPKETAEDRDGRVDFQGVRRFSGREIVELARLVTAFEKHLEAVGIPSDHPFWGAGIDFLDPSLRLDLEQELVAALSSIREASRASEVAAKALFIDTPLTASTVRILSLCEEAARSAPPHDGLAVTGEAWVEAQDEVRNVLYALKDRNSIIHRRSNEVLPEIWKTDLTSIADAYARYSGAWYKPLVGAYRTARQNLEPLLLSGAPGSPTERHQLVRDVCKVQGLERQIEEAKAQMLRLFGVQWRGLESDPHFLESLTVWVLDLHQRVASGELPSGLLSFLQGSPDIESVTPKVRDAEAASKTAIENYQRVANLLKFPSINPSGEPWHSLEAQVEKWGTELPKLPAFLAYNEVKRRLSNAGLDGVIEVSDRWPLAQSRLRDSMLRSYYTGVLREAMESRPELKTFERVAHESAVSEFVELDDFKLKYNRAEVRLAHHRGLPIFDRATGNLQLLKLQCELQRKHKPIRWAMSRAGEAIQRIKPVFMMSPLSVAIHLPPELPPFDLVVFDEASQIKPEDALCAIVRAKQTIVVGDTRQMPPSSFFDRVVDEEETEEDSPEEELGNEARKLESVLSLMSAVVAGQVRRPDLRWHYRSVHPSLIQPSNEMFYDNRLIVFPSAGTEQQGRRIGVVFHYHPETIYESGARNRVNRREAELIADQVVRQVQAEPGESLLVAAMNKTQADLIYNEVQIRERNNLTLFAAYRERHPHEPFDVKNLENVQGDERDVIFISVTYGKDASGVVKQTFGPLLQDGGERRLNVLITRARKRCEVFSNMTADDIRLDDRGRPGIQALKRYLRYAKDGFLDVSVPTGGAEESPFEEEVTAALRDHGYDVHCQVGSEGYRIDIGVIDPESPGRYLLGIECDGATYHSARSSRDRDKLRQRILEHRGWTIHRIWSHDWWQDREGEVARLIEALGASRKPQTPKKESESVNSEPVVIESDRVGSLPPPTRPYESAPVRTGLFTASDLANYLVQIVEVEGPIHQELLISRLRTAAGYGRAGSNVRQFLEGILHANRGAFQFVVDGYYSNDEQLKLPRDWSSRPAAERKTEWVTEVEIAAALRSVVPMAFGITRASAGKEAFNLLGFKRVTESAIARANAVVDRMIEGGAFSVQGELLVPGGKRR